MLPEEHEISISPLLSLYHVILFLCHMSL